MALITWDASLSVGLVEIDQQHQKLVQIINDLHESFTKVSSKETLAKIIKGLVEYTVIHFGNEEWYFVKFGYPDTPAHKKQHQEFVHKISDFNRSFQEGRLLISMEILDYLKSWLIHHIMGTDTQYVPFMKEKGLK
jgi:hemerythrin